MQALQQVTALLSVVMVLAMAMKHMKPAHKTAMRVVVAQVRFLTALMMIAVQSHGLVMAMQIVKIRHGVVT